MWLITIESVEDGTWWDEPMGFDSESEARDYEQTMPDPPPGYCNAIWECRNGEILRETKGEL